MKRLPLYGFCLLLGSCGGRDDTPVGTAEADSNPNAESPAADEGDEREDDTPAPATNGTDSNGSEQVEVGGLIGTEPEQTPDPVPDTATPAVPSFGCGQAPGLSSGEQTLDVAGTPRTFVLDVPASYDPSVPLPLVFGFHGATTSGSFFRSAFYGNLLSAMGDEAIVVHPTALGEPTSWDTETDLPFFDALFVALVSNLCVDETRVFATGHSSGGFFTNTLGCQRGDVLRAIAPVSGGGPFVFGNQSCTGEVAVWLAHAENDEVVLFENGEGSRDRWIDLNGCDAATSVAASPEGCVDYGGCSDGLPVRWCVYQDGHNWPDFAPQGMWDFFTDL